jgi:hypothetical protein
MSGLRFNKGKPKWSLVPMKSLLPLVRMLEYGAAKYSHSNWKKGFKKKEVWESLFRHVIALQYEEYDEESKVHHIGGVFANALFYSFLFVTEAIDPKVNWQKHIKKTNESK